MACRIRKKIEQSTIPRFKEAYKKLLRKYDTFLKLDEEL